MTNKQQFFISNCDPEIIEELHEEQMIDRYVPFSEFKRNYQVRHSQKYGCPLKLFKKQIEAFTQNPYAPFILIPLGALYFALLGLIM